MERSSNPQAVGRFTLLDALRGIAALVVVQFHLHELFGRLIFPHGYLAVDFFFMLSGFVLRFAYQQRLDTGWSLSRFLRVRLIRLYPLYLLGLLLGLGMFLLDRRGLALQG
jgi:peptidoglycan/LPS O-acetylase OafA/YrhL